MKRSKKNTFHYEIDISWSPEDKCFIANVPELDGCMSHGNSYAEAARNAEIAILLYIDTLQAKGKEVPPPLTEQHFSGKLPLRMEATLHRDLALRSRREKRSINELVIVAIRKQIYG